MSQVPLKITHALRSKMILWAFLSYAAAFALFRLFVPADTVFGGVVESINSHFIPLFVAVLCYLVSLSVQDVRIKWAWRLIGLYFFFSSMEQFLTPSMMAPSAASPAVAIDPSTGFGPGGYLSGSPRPGADSLPTPGPGGPPSSLTLPIFWALMYAPLAAGLLLFMPRSLTKTAVVAAGLDALVATLGLGLLAFQFSWSPVLFGPQGQGVAEFGVWRAVGNILLLLAMLSVVMGWSLERVSTTHLRILGALCLQVVAGMIFSLSSQTVGNSISGLGGVLAAWSTVVWGLAAISQVRSAPHTASSDRWGAFVNLSIARGVRVFSPYLALPIVGVILYSEVRGLPQVFEGRLVPVVYTAVVVVVLIVVRQIVTLNDVAKLTDRLSGLNDMATRLSACQTAEEMMATGSELAILLNSVQTCMLWKNGEDGLPVLISQRGLSAGLSTTLANSKKLPAPLREAIGSSQVSVIKASDLRPIAPESLRHSWMIVAPLLSRGTVLGSLSLWLRPAHIPDSAELRHAQAIAAQMGVALENVNRLEEVRALADQDGETGLLNHRAVHERLRVELLRAQRFGHSLAVLMIDLNGFKMFNDTFGHPAGDKVIRQVANLLRNNVRAMDLVGRYGGDEFIVILPETDADGASIVAAKLRAAIAEDGYRTEDGQVIPIGASFGVACFPDDAIQIEQLVALADVNLYESKHRGGKPVAKKDMPGDDYKASALGILSGLVTAVDAKDHYTHQHSQQVTAYALAIADAIGLTEQMKQTLRLAGLFHDVWKIDMPDLVLGKPASLSDEEFALIEQHAQLGELIAQELPEILDVMAAIGAHHERIDGRGYPHGLQDEKIPLLGRILALAEAYAVMTSDRPCRKALTHERACQELQRVACTQLDSELVQVFLSPQFQDEHNIGYAS